MLPRLENTTLYNSSSNAMLGKMHSSTRRKHWQARLKSVLAGLYSQPVTKWDELHGYRNRRTGPSASFFQLHGEAIITTTTHMIDSSSPQFHAYFSTQNSHPSETALSSKCSSGRCLVGITCRFLPAAWPRPCPERSLGKDNCNNDVSCASLCLFVPRILFSGWFPRCYSNCSGRPQCLLPIKSEMVLICQSL